MAVIVREDFEQMSAEAARDLFALLQQTDQPLICTASGASPAGMYKEFVRLVQESGTDISGWYFIGLDEWMGMNGDDAGSSRYQLNAQLFAPLGVSEEQIFFFDGKSDDPEAECSKAEAFIAARNGIDVAVLGIGVNAHIAMNEPGTSPALRSHVANILPETQSIGQKYFTEAKVIDKGITLGLATLNESKHMMILASGSSKAKSIQRMLKERVSTDCPATFLRDHPNLSVYADAEAAALL